MGLLNTFFTTDVTIEISLDAFVVSSTRTSFRLGTLLYLVYKQDVPYIVELGEEVTDHPEFIRVDLFKPNTSLSLPYEKSEYLYQFLRYCIAKARPLPMLMVSALFPFLRATVTFKGVEAFETMFCGYQKALFALVAKEAGARRVKFE
jgi:hypothetical protein